MAGGIDDFAVLFVEADAPAFSPRVVILDLHADRRADAREGKREQADESAIREEARLLLDSIDTSHVVGLRDSSTGVRPLEMSTAAL
jgi:hypothetical protein